ncbi:hypothetical protein LIER_24851 [Lithospermum erythrorhizon]|uniref:CCT domain-containing protein n=1 Tax=Lithospermum erythrorhizon TaxID=34254 RepID=A0AAV3R6W1_LITER
MSSELFIFDNSFFSDLNDSSINHYHDILASLPNSLVQDTQLTPVESSTSFDEIASIILSSSPPSNQLQNLSLYQNPSLFQNGCPSLDSGCAEFSPFEVKTEESHVSFDTVNYGYNSSLLVPQGYLGLSTTDNADKFMQRSYSSNSFDNKPNCLFQPCFETLMESTNFQNHVVSSPESSNFSSNQMRRVCSTGDLHSMKTSQTRNVLSSSPLSTERSFIEDSVNMKVGKYSAEERKERIGRYRAKRNQRNFNKTIKYACRKTLADNRPRIRGRFARNDEPVEIPKTAMFNRFAFEDEDDIWVEGFQEEEENGPVVGSAPLFSSFNSMTQKYHHQYYSYP